MADVFTKKKRSEVMALIRSKNTKLEQKVFRHLQRKGVYFKKHHDKVFGRPDIVLVRKRRAVFIDSGFWHGWQYPRWKKRLSSSFWQEKIEKNRQRDRRVTATLRRNGWEVLRVWSHRLEKGSIIETLFKIENFLKN